MKHLKRFNESYSSSDVDDIKELYIEFRDEWGFTETKNVHNPGDNECVWRLKDSTNIWIRWTTTWKDFWAISMSFQIRSQDVDMCYSSLIEMCNRIRSLNSDLRVYHRKSYSDIGNLYLGVDILPPINLSIVL
jgi:hypothetical protein